MIELVATLPVIMILIFGSVEMCNTIFLKQFITEVTYQGALEASRPNADGTTVLQSMQDILDSRNVSWATIGIEGVSGTSFDLLASGEQFRVSVDIDETDQQSGPTFRRFIDMHASCVSVRQ